MTGFPIITADERMAAKDGIKGVIFGPAKIGKTSLLWTLDPAQTLFLDLEAGGLSVRGWGGDSLEVRDWETARDVACLLGGPNPAILFLSTPSPWPRACAFSGRRGDRRRSARRRAGRTCAGPTACSARR